MDTVEDAYRNYQENFFPQEIPFPEIMLQSGCLRLAHIKKGMQEKRGFFPSTSEGIDLQSS